MRRGLAACEPDRGYGCFARGEALERARDGVAARGPAGGAHVAEREAGAVGDPRAGEDRGGRVAAAAFKCQGAEEDIAVAVDVDVAGCGPRPMIATRPGPPT